MPNNGKASINWNKIKKARTILLGSLINNSEEHETVIRTSASISLDDIQQLTKLGVTNIVISPRHGTNSNIILLDWKPMIQNVRMSSQNR